MLQVNNLIGFGSGQTDLVRTQIGQGVGTAIGDATSNGGLAAAFDTTTSQAAAAAARGGAGVPYCSVGKSWGSSKIITQYKVYAPNNVGFSATGAATITFTLWGLDSTPGAWDNIGSGGNLLHTAAGQANSISGILTFNTGITISTGYSRHWVQAVASSGANEEYFAEAEFWEDI